MTRTLGSLLIAGCFALHVRSARAEVWQDLAKWKLGDKPCVAEEAEKLIKGTPLDQRGDIENALIRIVGSADATPESRRFSCRMLQRIGTDKCVPVLARLLTDEKLSHYARLALQRRSSRASSAALPSATTGPPRPSSRGSSRARTRRSPRRR